MILWILLILTFKGSIAFSGEKPQINFNKNNKFKVLQLTDIHFGANIIADFRNVHLIDNLEKHSKPDFVAMTGDTVCSNCRWNTSVPRLVSEGCWNFVAHTMKTLKTKYGITIGNHDCEGREEKSRIALINWDSKFQNSYSKMSEAPVSGGSTYYVPIYSNLNKSNLAIVLWFFDTKDHGCMNLHDSEGCVEKDQIEWFEQKEQFLRGLYGNYFISIAFAHIPPPEFVYLYNKGEVYGNKYEDCSCPNANTGWIDAMISRNVKALFVGHDHDNDYGGFYNGIELVEGRKTGFGYYGPSHFKRGGRVIEFEEIQGDVIYKHYVIEGDGKIIENGPATHRSDIMPDCIK